MTTFQKLLVLATLATFSVDTVHSEQALRMSYRFAFEDEGVLEPGREPTQEEVEAVLCQTNVFYSKSFQQTFQNPKIAVVTNEADYAFDNYQFVGADGMVVEMPANINFTLSVMTTDGTTPPTFNEILEALPNLNYNAYLTKFVWKAAPVTHNFFFEAKGIVWKSMITENVQGKISDIDCPEGARPDAMVEGGQTGDKPKKEAVNATDSSAYNGFSVKLGFWDGKERHPTEMEWEALICQIDHFINGMLKKKLHDPSIASYSTTIHWEFIEEEYLPAQVNFTIAAFSGNGAEVTTADLFGAMSLTDVEVANLTSKYINKAYPDGLNVFAQVDKLYFRGEALRESDPATTLAKATCPVMVRSTDLASFDLRFEFEDDVEREPTRDEIEAMICEANMFFQKTLRDELGDPSILSHATNIDWTYNAADQYSSIVTFTALSLYGDGSHVKGSDVFDIMQAADVQQLSERYILNSVPLEQNLFYFSKNLYFTGSTGREIINAKIPNGVTCKNSNNYDAARLPMFSIQIGFDTRTGIPTEQDVKGLMCQTNLYFEHRLRQALHDDEINSHVTNIDWSYVPGAKMPAIIDFTPFSTYGDGTLIPGKVVYDTMKVIEVEDYVRNYAWNSEPYETNIYWDTRDIQFSGEVATNVREGKLARVTCVAPGLANASPNVTEASGPTAGEAATKHVESQSDKHMTHLHSHE